jgi:hypothetical protein
MLQVNILNKINHEYLKTQVDNAMVIASYTRRVLLICPNRH